MHGNISYFDNTRTWVLCLLLVFCSLPIWGQRTPTRQTNATDSYLFEHYSQEKGLSQGSGYAITSYDGFMWFGTQDGLNQFNGYDFNVFRTGSKQSLNANFIQTLLTDKRGRFWVGTTRGLNLYHQGKRSGSAVQFDTFSNAFHVKHVVDTASIEKLIEDKVGNIWIMTDESGLFCFNPITRKIKTHLQARNSLVDFCLAPDGTFWVATDQEVYYFDVAQGKLVSVAFKRNENVSRKTVLRAITVDTEGRLWVGTFGDGLFVVDNPRLSNSAHQYTQGTSAQSITSNDVVAFLNDKSGNIWVGTRTGGISIYSPATQQFIHVKHSDSKPRSLAGNYILSFFEDQQSNVWVGLSGGGIDKFDPRQYPFRLMQSEMDQPQNSLPDNMVFALLAQGEHLYIGTQTGGMTRYSLETHAYKLFQPEPANTRSLLHGQVYDFSADSAKHLWLATGKGLCMFDPVSQLFSAYPNEKSDDLLYLYAVQVLHNQTEVWTGGDRGLDRFDLRTKTWKKWKDVPDLQAISNYVVRLIYEDPQDRIWFGTFGHGLIMYDPKTKHTTAFSKGISCSNIFCLLEVGHTLWVGTDCGLYRIDVPTKRVMRHYSMADGLPNDVIYGILPDERGNFWLSSNKGLTCFSPIRGVLKNYDVTDGLQSNEFNTSVCYRHTDGTLFFGGVNGINYFKLDDIKSNRYVPPIRITSVSVFDSLYNPNLEHLILDPNQNFITFEFAALNFSNSRKNQYQYQLEGVDPGWVRAGHRRTANYTKLPPGDYVFRVKGSNDDGVWNEQGISMNITIRPPFWATLWFRAGMITLLLAGLFGLYRYRVGQLRRQQEQALTLTIRTQELERQRFAKELHDGVGANLAVLKMYLSSLGSPKIPVEELKNRSLTVLQSSLNDIRSIIHDMHPRSLSESGLVQTIADMVGMLNESHSLNVAFNSQNVPRDLPENSEINLFRIIQELLQNAMKHAQSTQVALTISADVSKIHIDYHDNGRGFDMTLLHSSTGNGLVNIRQRVELIKGTCQFVSAPGQGTTATIVVPIFS